MPQPRISHSPRCISLKNELERLKWCIGNGGCGQTNCHCEQLRKAYQLEHALCEERLRERIFKHQASTAMDGKSLAAGN